MFYLCSHGISFHLSRLYSYQTASYRQWDDNLSDLSPSDQDDSAFSKTLGLYSPPPRRKLGGMESFSQIMTDDIQSSVAGLRRSRRWEERLGTRLLTVTGARHVGAGT